MFGCSGKWEKKNGEENVIFCYLVGVKKESRENRMKRVF